MFILVLESVSGNLWNHPRETKFVGDDGFIRRLR